MVSNETEVYASEFLVVATGENGEGFVPEVLGLAGFEGKSSIQASTRMAGDLVGKMCWLSALGIPAWRSRMISPTGVPNPIFRFAARYIYIHTL